MIPTCLRQYATILIAVITLFVNYSVAIAYQEPFSIQNRFPLQYMFLSPRPISAILPQPGTVQANAAFEYSNVYMDEKSERWNMLMDMEIAVFDISVTYAISSFAALRLDAPVVQMGDGFLDGFLKDFHDALGLPNYGREDRPHNEFAYQMTKADTDWVDGDSGAFHLADMTLSANWALPSSILGDNWQNTLLTSIKFPTGDSSSGFGSGNFDFGLFLPLQLQIDPWTLFMMPGYIYHGDPDTEGAQVSAQESGSFAFGAAYKMNEKLYWIGQLSYFSSPIERIGIAKIDDGAYDLTIGFRRKINTHWGAELAFTEDLFTRATPDFCVRFGIIWHHGE